VIRSHGTSAIHARRGIIEALAVDGAAARGAPPAMRTFESEGALARFATAFLQTGEADSAPYVLHGLSLIGAVDGGWSDFTVATLVHRLVDGWPSYPAAPALLGHVVASAASAGQWPIARRAYDALTARYRGSSIASTAGVELAEALVRAGATAHARNYLKDALTAGGEIEARALLLLARIEEGLGNRPAALAAYDRVLREHPGVERSNASLQSHAALLKASGRHDAARAVLQRIVAASAGEVAAEASYHIAEILRVQGDEAGAAEWYMTAAYVAEGSKWERPSLLGAVRSLTALRHMDEALIIYRKALAPRDAGQGASASPLGAGR
jgi:tetratricopeptide (TPR) repeat protein